MLSFFALPGFEAAVKAPASSACSTFNILVVHSKLSTLLLSLFRSLWLTTSKSLGGRKCFATSPWTTVVFFFPSLDSFTTRYPLSLVYPFTTAPRLKTMRSRLSITWRSTLRTLPRLLTSYSPSQPVTGFHSSSMAHILRRYASMARRICSATDKPVCFDSFLSFRSNGSGRNVCVRFMHTLYSSILLSAIAPRGI